MSYWSNIVGVSINGNLLTLWDEKGVAVHSVPLNFPDLTQVHSIGGLDNDYARGFLLAMTKVMFTMSTWKEIGRSRKCQHGITAPMFCPFLVIMVAKLTCCIAQYQPKTTT